MIFSLRSTITKKVLNYFFINKHEKKYVRDLANILEVDPKNLDTKLKELEAAGLFLSEFMGREKYYFLNKSFPLLKEYEQIVAKTIGLQNILKDELSQVKGIKEAYIFGSYARNSLDISSDIDILVIGTHKALNAQKIILKLQKQLNREFNIIDMTPEEFEKKKKDAFIVNIFSKPIIKIL